MWKEHFVVYEYSTATESSLTLQIGDRLSAIGSIAQLAIQRTSEWKNKTKH